MHRLATFLYVEAKFGPLKKKKKKRLTTFEKKISGEELSTLSVTTKGMRTFWKS